MKGIYYYMGIHDKRPQELIDTVKRIKNKFGDLVELRINSFEMPATILLTESNISLMVVSYL